MRLDGKPTPKGDLDYEIECVVNALDGIGAPAGDTLADRIWALKRPPKVEDDSGGAGEKVTAILRRIATAPWRKTERIEDWYSMSELPNGWSVGTRTDEVSDLAFLGPPPEIHEIHVDLHALTREQQDLFFKIRDRLMLLAQGIDATDGDTAIAGLLSVDFTKGL